MSQGTVVERFENNVLISPDSIAVQTDRSFKTYQELNEHSNQLARSLIEYGVKQGDVVGLYFHSSIDLITTIIAILKAGGCYAILDPANPVARLRKMVEKAPKIELIITQVKQCSSVFTNTDCLAFAQLKNSSSNKSIDNLNLHLDAKSLCYTVFTSGSTGDPKAVLVRHDSWYNLLSWFETKFSLGANSSNLLATSIGFDISQRNIMTPLFCGATLHLLESKFLDVARMGVFIEEHEIKTIHCAPSFLYLLVELYGNGKSLNSLQFVFIGGEKFDLNRVLRWAKSRYPKCLLVHQYGVAECTDVATSYTISDTDFLYASSDLPVGYPISNSKVIIVDDSVAPLPEGQRGEILITGLCVGDGYASDPELNKSFLEVEGHGVCYKTGDMGVIINGSLYCLGRSDKQIKIRGMLVNIEEIEKTLKQQFKVRDAVVTSGYIDEKDAVTILIAFVDCHQLESYSLVDFNDLRAELDLRLPRHMIPDKFVFTNSLPLSVNGKVDRKKLAHSAKNFSSFEHMQSNKEVLSKSSFKVVAFMESID